VRAHFVKVNSHVRHRCSRKERDGARRSRGRSHLSFALAMGRRNRPKPDRASKKPAAAPPASQKLTVAERRAFIWANPRTRLKGAPGPYDLCAAHTDRDRADDRRGYSPREVRGEGGV
jgi:hypothetical protein